MTNYLKQKEEEIKKIYKQQIIDIELKLTTSINMIKRMEQELKHKDSIITQLSNKIKTLESTENQNSSKLKKYINIFNINQIRFELINLKIFKKLFRKRYIKKKMSIIITK